MKLSIVARQIIASVGLSISRIQASALLLLFTLMMPIAAPIPAWAYDLDLPEPATRNGQSLRRPSTGPTLIDRASSIRNTLMSVLADVTEPAFLEILPVSPGSESTDLKAPESLQPKDASESDNLVENGEVEFEREAVTVASSSPASLLIDDDESQVIRESSYSSENNIGKPPGKFEVEASNGARATRIEHRAGIANFSFGLPIAELPGRGISASIGMTYNSRLWNKSQTASTTTYTYNVDKNWISPGFTLGYGSLTSHFAARTIRMNNGDLKTYNEVVPDGYTDIDGTRHQLEPKIRQRIPGTEQASDAGVNNYFYPEYGTKDGTFVRVMANEGFVFPITAYQQPNKTYYAYTSFNVIQSDGTRITYSVPGSQFGANDYTRDHYPITIQDSNGNQIDIGYLNGTDRIQVIEDTLGRHIKFYYDGAGDKLIAVTVPGFGTSGERQTVRFYYDDEVALPTQDTFSGTVVAPQTYRALRYVYFPATQSGYRYDYHSLGMIKKITKLMGMTVSTQALNSTGTVTSSDTATMAATTEYNYDLSSTPLTDVPKFDQRADVWQGPTSSMQSLTYYASSAAGGEVTTEVTVPQGDLTVKYATVANAAGYTKETSVTQVNPNQFSKLMSKTAYTWDIKDAGNVAGSYYTWLKKIEVTNDANQTRATEFDVDSYNNRKLVRECAIAPPGSQCTELRRTETIYATGPGWINNNILRLPEVVTTKVSGTPVSKSLFAYDEESLLQETPGVVQHNPAFNPNQGTHLVVHYECDGQPSPPRCADGTPADRIETQVPNYDARYHSRGNLTKISSFSDATLSSDPNASVRTLEYDMTGNVINASMSCCNVKAIEYSSANQYAYPTKETKGLAPSQLITSAIYDFDTGLVVSSKDENERQTSYTYDPDTLRQTRVDYPNGAWITSEINNTQFPYFAKTTSSLDSNRSVSSWSFFDGAGLGFRSRSLTANGYISSDVEFDSVGRAKKTFNPYTVAALNTPRPEGIKFTEATAFDGLGRVTETTLTDATKVYSYPNEATVTYTAPGGQTIVGTISRAKDQAGKERRQVVDALGRIVRVDEPDASGNLGSVAAPAQPTFYEYDGNDNLGKVIQADGTVTQERAFVYDSLSRLTRERQVEANPRLDADGNHGSESPTKWTGVYKYTLDGLLDYGIDARGVKTDFTYDGLNRVMKVEYFGETGSTTPTVNYTYDESRTDSVLGTFYNNGRLTTVSTQEINVSGGQFTPKTIQKYDYKEAGEVVRHEQTIDQQTYNLQYGYNLAGQLVSEKYPSGKVISMTVDNFGVVQTVSDGTRNFLNGVTMNSKGQLSQVNLGNGTHETFTYNDRFQLESQSLMRGTDVLQKYNYNYGDLDSSGSLKNNGKLEQIESYIGASKQWTQNFRYDSIGRLKESSEKRGDTNALTYKQVFDFDRFGNLYRKTASNPTTGQANPIPFTPIEETDISKSTNRFTTGTTYNDAGQVTTDNKFRSMGFSYDANGRVVKVTKAATPDAHTVYDALGNRVATKIDGVWQYMIYDAFGQLVAEYGVPSEGMGGVKYVQQDHQGSVRTITNASSFVVSRTDHQAFGESIGSGVGLRNVNQGYGNDPAGVRSDGEGRLIRSAAYMVQETGDTGGKMEFSRSIQRIDESRRSAELQPVRICRE